MNREIFLHIIIVILICIIVLCSLKTKVVEKFESESIPYLGVQRPTIVATSRPCELYLTNVPSKCNEMKDMYKLGKVQVQVMINSMKNKKGLQDIVKALEEIYNQKQTIPVTSCKMEFNGLIEINSSDKHDDYKQKTVTSESDYDLDKMTGYCLMEVNTPNNEDPLNQAKTELLKYKGMVDLDSVEIVNHVYINDNGDKKYAAVKINNAAYVSSITGSKNTCTVPSTDLEDGMRFIKLYCDIKDTKLLTRAIDIVKFNKSKNIFEIIDFSKDIPKSKESDDKESKSKEPTETESIMDDFNKAFYSILYVENGAIGLQPIDFETSVYVFTFNLCDNVEKYTITKETYDKDREENIPFTFSMNDLKNNGVSLKNELNLPFSDDTKILGENEENKDSNTQKITDDKDRDITDLLVNKINNADAENEALQMKINEYDNTLKQIADNYKSAADLCKGDNYEKCLQKSNENITNMYKLVSILKEETIAKHRKNKDMKQYVTEIKIKMAEAKVSLSDVNESITQNIPRNKEGKQKQNGITIPYNKYATYISNDDCMYVKF